MTKTEIMRAMREARRAGEILNRTGRPTRLKLCVCGAKFIAVQPYTRKRCDACELEAETARMRRRHSTAAERVRFAVKNGKRRMRVAAGELFDKADIFARDRYVCQLCGGQTDPTAHHQANAYPSLDHIVPLAQGGAHEPSNVQTAHRGCNSAKGARAAA